MEHIDSIAFLILWPLFIFVSFKFIKINLKHFKKLERLEELEKLISIREGDL